MNNKELSLKAGEDLRLRGYLLFRMTWLDEPSFIKGVGIEAMVGSSVYRNAWIIKDEKLMTPEKIADLAATWMDAVYAAPEKYRAQPAETAA